MTDLSVSIVSYNTRDLLRECLASVRRETRSLDFEVIVVDNASVDGSVEMLRSDFPGVRVIANSRNAGFAAANNQALAQSAGRYFLLLNPDTVVLDGALEKLVSFMDAHPEAGVAGPQLVGPDGTLQISHIAEKTLGFYARMFVWNSLSALVPLPIKWMLGRGKDFSLELRGSEAPASSLEVGSVAGACFMVRRAAIERVGPLDERYFLYSEETDWARRMRQAGWKVLFFPRARVLHHQGRSADVVGDFAQTMLYTSHYRYVEKYYGAHGVWLLRSMLCVRAACETLLEAGNVLGRRSTVVAARRRLRLTWRTPWLRPRREVEAPAAAPTAAPTPAAADRGISAKDEKAPPPRAGAGPHSGT
jgi:N-acetylglucosaminyl-diphospho-decaprenol L-rhamnosyltransferase